MNAKEILTTQMRNNEFELKGEIQRVKDHLTTLEVGSSEYAKTLDAYNTLLTQEKEIKKLDTEVKKVIYGAAIGIGGMLLYRKLIDKSADPFFREIGRNLLKVVHI